jgi:hypothetical protein
MRFWARGEAHGAAQFLGLAAVKSASDHGHAQHLLLEEGTPRVRSRTG